MDLARFRFRDHLENGEQLESETSSELYSVSSDGGDESEPESMTGKGIKRLCAELVELKSAADEEFHKNVYSDYSAFLRISEEARVMESELTLLRNDLVAEKQLVRNLAEGVYLKVLSKETIEAIVEAECDEERCSMSKLEAHTDYMLENLDTLLCEQRLDEALSVLEMEEVVVERILSEEEHDMDVLSFYNSSISGRKAMLANKFSILADNPRVNRAELRTALIGLCRLGESRLATQLLLRHYRSRMKKGLQYLQFSKTLLNDLYIKQLSKFVFSTISQTAQCFLAVHGAGETSYASELIEWAHEETAVFASCFSLYVESVSETRGGLSIGTESVHIAMRFCSMLENQGIVLQPCLMKHIRPSLEKVLESQIRHFKSVIGIYTSSDTWALSRYLISGILGEGFPLVSTGEEVEYCLLTSSGRKFITLLQAVIKDVNPLFTVEMGSIVIEGITNLFMEYISIAERAMTMTNKSDVPYDGGGGSITMAAESVLHQVSILLNMSTVQYFFSNFLTNAIYDTRPRNLENATSYAVDSQEKQLKESILRVNETYGLLKCHFHRRFIDLPASFEHSHLGLTGSCLDDAHKSTVGHDLPSLKFQVLFLKLRKLEEFSEENAIEDVWLMELLTGLIKALFFSISDDKQTWMAIREDAESQDVASYKQLVLDIQFVVEIARYEGCLTDDLLVASATLISQLESAVISAELGPNRELNHIQWAAWATNSATKSIQMLLEVHAAKPASKDQDVSSPEEPYDESHNGSSCLEDDLSEESDELEDRLEMDVKQVFIDTQELSLTRPNIKEDDGPPSLPHKYHSEKESLKSAYEDSETEDADTIALDETRALTDI